MTDSKIKQLFIHCMQRLTAPSSSAYDRGLAERDPEAACPGVKPEPMRTLVQAP